MTIYSTLTSVLPEEFNERFSWYMSTCTHVTTTVEPTATMESTNSPPPLTLLQWQHCRLIKSQFVSSYCCYALHQTPVYTK